MAMNCSKIAEEIKSENDSRMLRLLLTDPTIENKRKDTITSSFTSNELHKETVTVNHNLNYTSKTPTIFYKRNISLWKNDICWWLLQLDRRSGKEKEI